jgi:hypothetical protein
MANYSISHDLLKLNGAFVTNITGRTATKRCICIPIDESGLILGKKGCYLNSVAIEMKDPQYNDTHCIKIDLPKEQRETMSEEDMKALPIIGGLHQIERKPTQGMPVTGTTSVEPGGCPF